MSKSIGKIYGYPGTATGINDLGAGAWKAQIAAKYNEVTVDFEAIEMGKDNKTEGFLAKWPLGKVPVFESADGSLLLNESNAIAYYCANIEGSKLLGANKQEAAQIQSYIAFGDNEFMPVYIGWLYPILGYSEYNQQISEKAQVNARRAMAFLNAKLSSCTFLVGERITLADICVAVGLLNLYKSVFDPAFIAEFKNVTRWYLTIMNQPIVKSVAGPVVMATKAAVYDPKATKAVPAAKAEVVHEKAQKKEKAPKEKKEPVEDLEAIAAAELSAKAKEKNPLDLLPKSSFVLDEWKRFYSNNETRPTAVDWFWQNFDPTGYSVYKVDYKYNNELTQVFMSSNLIGGFFQRLDSARKYAFGSMLVLGVDGKNQVTGYFVVRGSTLPFEITDSPGVESFSFVKVDDKSKAVRDDVNAVFAWDEKIRGLACADGKVFK